MRSKDVTHFVYNVTGLYAFFFKETRMPLSGDKILAFRTVRSFKSKGMRNFSHLLFTVFA